MADKKVLGVFEGECADSNITNKNGLDITRPVWENVFSSEEYKTAIELGHLIGFLGHPEDPGCQDFEHACIVMTEGSIDDEGKVHGKFNLVDTPVGRIVKSFIDAGVTFGISVRGAGDIIDNSVDPDTFVFRGFDLVTFPAYPEAIPTFTEIAASEDIEKQKQYKAVCAAVKDNISGLVTNESIEILQSQFAKQSDEYKALEQRKAEINAAEGVDVVSLDIKDQKIEGMTNLYIEKSKEASILRRQNAILAAELKRVKSQSSRKIASMERIVSSRLTTLEREVKYVTAANAAIKSTNKKIKASVEDITIDRDQIAKDRDKVISENTRLKSDNLKYKQRIEATANDINSKDEAISKLQSELDETVKIVSDTELRASNLEASVKKLRKEVSAASALVQEYQEAYGNIYANALGVHLEDVRVTSSTSVKELQKIIGSANTLQSYQESENTPTDIVDENYDGQDLVTL